MQYFPESIKLSSLPAIGSYVAAIWEEEEEEEEGLFRARVEAVDVETCSVEVEFIDFGNTAQITLGDLRILPDRLYKYPACVNLVAIGHIPHSKDAPLPSSVLNLLSGIVGQLCTILIIPSSEDGPLECMLTKDGQVLNEVIAEMLMPKCIPTPVIESLPEPAVVQMPSLREAPPEPAPPPVDNTMGLFFYEDGPFLELPKAGVTFKALILSADSPQTIMLCSAEDESLFSILEELDVLLASYKGGASSGHSPKVGEVCLVLSPLQVEDNEEMKLVWYRAVCLYISKCDAGIRYFCILVDYGRTVVVETRSIRRIPKRLVHFLPFVAQPAVLSGLEDLDNIPKEFGDRFKELVQQGSQIDARVIYRNDEHYVLELPAVTALLLNEGFLNSI